MSAEALLPRSYGELPRALSALGEKGRIIAGGTDLVIQMRLGRALPDKLLYAGAIPELRETVRDAEKLLIGAYSPLGALAENPALQPEFAAIGDAAGNVGSPQIRAKATLGGNVVNASPASDLLPNLYMLEAEALLLGPSGELRATPVEKLILGPGKTALAPNELITGFSFSVKNWEGWRSGFVKLGFRSRVTVARIGVSFAVRGDREGRITDAKIWAGAISLTPLRMKDAESILIGTKADKEAVKQAGACLAALIQRVTPEKFDRDYKVSASAGVMADACSLMRLRLAQQQ